MKKLAAISVVLGALVAFLAGPAAANTNPRAVVTVDCVGPNVVATFTYSGFHPENNLTATEQIQGVRNGVFAHRLFKFGGPGATDTLSAPIVTAGWYGYQAGTTVYGGAGRVKASASATVSCRRPAPPPPAVYAPRGWAEGPCSDPWYRFWFDNTRSTAPVVFRLRYNDYFNGWTTVQRTMAAGAKGVTRHRRVRGLTRMTITARGAVLYSRVSVAGGNWPACH